VQVQLRADEVFQKSIAKALIEEISGKGGNGGDNR
jgi:hypothetical protein